MSYSARPIAMSAAKLPSIACQQQELTAGEGGSCGGCAGDAGHHVSFPQDNLP